MDKQHQREVDDRLARLENRLSRLEGQIDALDRALKVLDGSVEKRLKAAYNRDDQIRAGLDRVVAQLRDLTVAAGGRRRRLTADPAKVPPRSGNEVY